MDIIVQMDVFIGILMTEMVMEDSIVAIMTAIIIQEKDRVVCLINNRDNIRIIL